MKCVSCLHHDIELQKVDTVCALHVDALDKERERERFCMSSPKRGDRELRMQRRHREREREKERDVTLFEHDGPQRQQTKMTLPLSLHDLQI